MKVLNLKNKRENASHRFINLRSTRLPLQSKTNPHVIKSKSRNDLMDASALASAEYWLVVIGWLKLLGAALVAIGVAMEFGGDFVARPFEKTVEQARQLEITRLKTAGLESQAEIKTAGARIAEAEAKSAEARVTLARLVNPRTLTPAQVDEIGSEVAGFKGTLFDLGIVGDDMEISELLPLVEQALNKGGWITKPWAPLNQMTVLVYDRSSAGLPTVGLISATGILFIVEPGDEAALWPAAIAAAVALRTRGVGAVARVADGTRSSNRHVIHVLIGKKPLPTLAAP